MEPILKILTNEDIGDFLILAQKMYKEIGSPLNSYEIITSLLSLARDKNLFTIFGYFIGDKLEGILFGYGTTANIFYILGLYSTASNNFALTKLLRYSKEKLKQLGFQYFEADTKNDKIAKLLQKYNAKILEVKYRGEL